MPGQILCCGLIVFLFSTMNILRLLLIFLAAVLLGWQIYLYASFDEASLQGAYTAAPARFIQSDPETLEALNVRLQELKPFPASILQEPSRRQFGREKVFLPDAAAVSQ